MTGRLDQPEVRYHFPSRYLRQVEEAVGDLILYYEPRRTKRADSRTGRQSYFAVARVSRLEKDTARPDHYYAAIEEFLEFDRLVPFRKGVHYYEAALMKADGTTSKGAFGRSVRLLSDAEFEVILRAGFSRELEPWEQPATGVAEPSITYAARPLTKQVVTRPFRDQQLRLPTHPEWYPHPSYLKWHREHVFKG